MSVLGKGNHDDDMVRSQVSSVVCWRLYCQHSAVGRPGTVQLCGLLASGSKSTSRPQSWPVGQIHRGHSDRGDLKLN